MNKKGQLSNLMKALIAIGVIILLASLYFGWWDGLVGKITSIFLVGD